MCIRDSGYAGTPATGKLFAFDASGADMSGMYIKGRPAELPSLFARSEHAGEKVMGLDHDLKLLKVFEADELRLSLIHIFRLFAAGLRNAFLLVGLLSFGQFYWSLWAVVAGRNTFFAVAC